MKIEARHQYFRFALVLALGVFVYGFNARAADEDTVLPDRCRIKMRGDRITFTDVELIWLCGNPDSEAWKDIPPAQKTYFARNFLQDRGYHSPSFRVDGDALEIRTGPRSRLEQLNVVGRPQNAHWRRRRNLIGEAMTPSLLDDLEKWAKHELSFSGYPCSQISSFAVPAASRGELRMVPGAFHSFGEVHAERDLPDGANTDDDKLGVLRRYFAFKPDWTFDSRLLEITSRRMLQDDLFLGSYFDWNCEPTYQLTQHIVTAKPRLLTVGVGVDSEAGPFGNARWKHSTLDRFASSFLVSLSSSFRQQELRGEYRKYFSQRRPFHLLTTVLGRHENEARYRTLTFGTGVQPATAVELPLGRVKLAYGPLLDYTKTIDGEGPRRNRTLHWLGQVDFMSHIYEYYLGDPQAGFTFNLGIDSRFRGVLAPTTAHRVVSQGQVLYNVLDWDPPVFILGWRYRAGTFYVGSDRERVVAVPVNERFFLGGDSDIRGFSRKGLPNSSRGFASFFYQGIELRAGKILPLNLQPLIFVDFAVAGVEPGSIKSASYWAPGVGLRYPSPIGVLRVTYATGETLKSLAPDPVRNKQFFLTFGQEL